MNVDEHSLAAYQNQVEAMRKSPYLDFPAHVHLETNALCNAACNFCPYPTLERKRHQDARRAHHQDHRGPARHSRRTCPFSCRHSKSMSRFSIRGCSASSRKSTERLPNASLTLTTNASALTEKQLARLARVRNLDYLWISMNDHREAEYEATMQLPYRRTIERMRMIHDGARRQAASRCAWCCRGSATEAPTMSNSCDG